MVKVTEATPIQINTALIDVQNQINNLNFRLEKLIADLNKKEASKPKKS